uniref:(northern house mosquito) hypothetical protein n=1 Tax=Culex pipiens TaxID=7175 RepID=A0A8D8GML2_CULPI
MYAVGRGVGDKSCRESRRGSVYRVIRNRASQTMECTHTRRRESLRFIYSSLPSVRSSVNGLGFHGAVKLFGGFSFPLFPYFHRRFPTHTHTCLQAFPASLVTCHVLS